MAQGAQPQKSAAGVLRSASRGYSGKEGKRGGPAARALQLAAARSVAHPGASKR